MVEKQRKAFLSLGFGKFGLKQQKVKSRIQFRDGFSRQPTNKGTEKSFRYFVILLPKKRGANKLINKKRSKTTR